MRERKTYGDCTSCWVWGEAPSEFKQSKHFLVCPRCDKNMYMFTSSNPTEDGVRREANRVSITKVRLQSEVS